MPVLAHPTLADIRAGVAEVLETIQDAAGSPTVYKYATTNFVVPCIRILTVDEVNYDIASRGGGDSYVLIIQAIVGDIEAQASQEVVDAFISRAGAQSVKVAIEKKDLYGYASLGGRVDQAWVRRCSGYVAYNVGGQRTLGAEWEVQVETTG
jgi:hypothetical protein